MELLDDFELDDSDDEETELLEDSDSLDEETELDDCDEETDDELDIPVELSDDDDELRELWDELSLWLDEDEL